MSTVTKLASINQRLTKVLEEKDKELSNLVSCIYITMCKEEIRLLISVKRSKLGSTYSELGGGFVNKIVQRFHEKIPNVYCGEGNWFLKYLIKKNIQHRRDAVNRKLKKIINSNNNENNDPIHITNSINNNQKHLKDHDNDNDNFDTDNIDDEYPTNNNKNKKYFTAPKNHDLDDDSDNEGPINNHNRNRNHKKNHLNASKNHDLDSDTDTDNEGPIDNYNHNNNNSKLKKKAKKYVLKSSDAIKFKIFSYSEEQLDES
nr:11146_t:CDS:2 [Entrophospora candida]